MSSIIVLISSVIDNSPFRLFSSFPELLAPRTEDLSGSVLRITGAVLWLIYWFLQTTDFSVFFVLEHSEQIRTAVGDPDLRIRGRGAVIQSLR